MDTHTLPEQTLNAAVETSHAAEANFFNPEAQLVVITWVTFFVLLGILYKLAWKPILAALDKREESIRTSLDKADKIHQEFEEIHAARDRIITEARQSAQEIVNQSRKAAVNAAKVIEEKAREEAQILLENSRRELKTETERIQSELKKESAELAVNLATKILEEQLDSDKSRKLIDKFIKEI